MRMWGNVRRLAMLAIVVGLLSGTRASGAEQDAAPAETEALPARISDTGRFYLTFQTGHAGILNDHVAGDAYLDTPDGINVVIGGNGGYNITDASIRYQTGLGGLSLSVQNLFDKFYIDYSRDTRLPTDNLAFFAGRGRTFTLGWDYRF